MRRRTYRHPVPEKTKPREPFTFKWVYPIPDRKTIRHKRRKCEGVVRDKDGRKIKKPITVKAYDQVVR